MPGWATGRESFHLSYRPWSVVEDDRSISGGRSGVGAARPRSDSGDAQSHGRGSRVRRAATRVRERRTADNGPRMRESDTTDDEQEDERTQGQEDDLKH